ncbi:2-heptaprenyl-1,4-naphthoquinone methyltransferase [Prochlorococcus marinus str. MIT 9302]|uniref:Demethylmenaquinone methyltransferase n=1 Tax=Prochlorococcus marinus str. MIT 9302 TaxID=74545 RepID=A0A0A2A951_PROMR|nr:bifunctional demethylmenaquinone methyltransferase/2-methoxy-6-polyprenyl-1,4-benzoquinol methylase UbiE [Prochlorococcus marinus]KGF97376.1 2-heptaprenyl-1,4-naphthoquinone methyltransferase [Prochlorococcus marinus str. MIT 9302]
MKFTKTIEVKNIFNKISYKYDFLNNLLSFGLHKLWKRKLVNLLEPLNGEDWADLCCGTGDLAFLISKRVSPRGSITGIDSAKSIINIAKKKSEIKKNKFIKWEMKDVLEIDDCSKNFDGICMSYGLRNLNNVEEGIKKVFYLLNDKGRAGFLDFNHSSTNSLSNIFQKIYLRLIVVTISRIFNLSKEYAYIENSIRNFPKKNELIKIAKEVGFKKAEYRTIFFGQMGILILAK